MTNDKSSNSHSRSAGSQPDADTPPVDPCHRNWLWRVIQVLMQNVLIFWLRYRIHGREHFPPGGALFLINHQSSLDPLLLAATLKRPVSYLARHELFDRPGVGWILKNTYVMPIRRESAGAESIRLAVERLQQGYYVGLFPEGTRSPDGRLQEIKPGFLAIIRRANVPVIAAGVAGARLAYPRRAILPLPATVRVVLAEPISPESVAELSQRGREAEFLELIRQRMQAALQTAEAWRLGNPPSQ